MRIFILFLFLCFFCKQSYGQGAIQDSALSMSIISVHGAFQSPHGDMADRFGSNFSLGGGYAYKTSSNWLFGFEGSYLFGNNVKNPAKVLQPLRTSAGPLIAPTGQYATVFLMERGLHLNVYAGKIFPVFGPNPNSGILVKAGVGFLEHQIHIEARNDDLAFLEERSRQGYDRLTSGIAFTQFVGYQNMSNNRLVNFFIGAELIEGFTRGQRGFDIDEMRTNNDNRMDILLGIKAGWTLLLYPRKPNAFYIE